MKKNRAGIYCWAGPGTIRMVRLKFPQLQINEESLMSSYDLENLKAAKENIGLTDAWVTYSWGFSKQTEQPDYEFVRSKLDNFKKLGIKTHAYIQGPNLVYADHQDKDYWCRDHQDRLIPYHRGRFMTCLNNPNARNYIINKIKLALKDDFDGVFVDNLYFGLLPLVVGNKKVSFFGCRCSFCIKKYKKEEGGSIPSSFNLDSKEFKSYRDFRVRSVMEFASEAATLVKSKKKQIGSNSLDPKMDTQLYYGTDLAKLDKIQDYILFENHHLPRANKNNTYLSKYVDSLDSPIFVVSYKEGIGREKFYTQEDFDAIYTESQKLGYSPCYKASEYSFDGVENNFDFKTIRKVTEKKGLEFADNRYNSIKSLGLSWMLPLLNQAYVPFMRNYYNNPAMRKLFNWVYYKGIA